MPECPKDEGRRRLLDTAADCGNILQRNLAADRKAAAEEGKEKK
jgi:hypothetical protein